MRLLIVGRLNGQLTTAAKMAMSTGAKVSHVETCSAATNALRAGQGADLLMVDYELDIAIFAAVVSWPFSRPTIRSRMGSCPSR